jgi:AcrR family transcriptional regulator
MARKPARRGARRAAAPTAGASQRERIVEALLRLLATRRYAEIGLADVAAEAGVSLAELRQLYDSKLAIVSDFSKRIDEAVLKGGPAEGESPRDRLFDILMRRLDQLAPHKAALRRLARAAWCDPGLACGFYRIVERSMTWMLAAAGIHHGGLRDKVAVNGTVLVIGETIQVWLDDDDPGLARTMATLDRALRRGERAMGFMGDVCDLAGPFTGGRARGSRRPEAAG